MEKKMEPFFLVKSIKIERERESGERERERESHGRINRILHMLFS